MLSERELESSPLFRNITYEEYLRMLTCFQAVQKSYPAEELVYDFSAVRTDAIGVVERGSASLIRIDEEGVSTVLEEMGPGGVFGRDLAFAGSAEDSLEVVARTPCDVVFIDYPHLFHRCEKACTHHSILVQNLFRLLSTKTLRLSERVEVLSRRSIREKLLCYFDQLARREKSETVTLPFSLSALAEYISADRSAMMRELKKLKEEGVVQTENRRVTILP